jgi:hypothetical protein
MEEGRQLKLATAELGELNASLQAEGEAVRAANRRLGGRALLRALFQQGAQLHGHAARAAARV